MTHVDWHPYPEYKPKESGYYFYTFQIGTIGGPVGLGFFDEGIGEFEYNEDIVIAWAEINYPEPYRPPEPDDNHPDAITARKYAEGDPETVKALHIFDE